MLGVQRLQCCRRKRKDKLASNPKSVKSTKRQLITMALRFANYRVGAQAQFGRSLLRESCTLQAAQCLGAGATKAPTTMTTIYHGMLSRVDLGDGACVLFHHTAVSQQFSLYSTDSCRIIVEDDAKLP